MVIDEEASWSYRFGGHAVPEDWTSEGFDDSEWETGSGVFGWGHPSIDTPLDTSQNPRPIASYYRHAFSLEDVGSDGLILTTRAGDGVIVYVNGTEVARENLEEGSVSADTLANQAIPADTITENPLVIEVPPALLNDGENLITVEVHSSDRSTPSHSFTLIAEEA